MMTCRLCNKEAKVWEPMGGGPFTDVLCFKHRVLAHIKSPATYITLIWLCGFSALMYGAYLFFSWIMGS